ncbi:MAG: hypothetical protein ABR612_12280 [Chromatocurvus sp.]
MQEIYNIHFAGDIADGESIDEVRRKVGALFNAREATLDKLFSGKKQLIKRNCSRDEALKYQSAMQRAGALATITIANPDGDSATTDAGTSPSQPVATQPPQTRSKAQDQSELSLTPAGTEVLQPDERQTVPRRDMDLSAFSVAAAGERLGAPEPQAPPPPDTSHLTVADAGEAIPRLANAAPPPAPDTSALTLADPDSDLLDERYRQHDTPPAPGTDHLSVEPRHND